MRLKNEKVISDRLCDLIREERLARGVTQDELGKQLGISQSAVSKIEGRKLTPATYVWLTFCEVYSVGAHLPMDESRFKQRMGELKKQNTALSARAR